MQLWYAPTSPFARKVRVVLRIRGLEDRIDEIVVDPWADKGLRAKNPLSKVPTLILDDGSALYDSGVICDYLDTLGSAPRLFPAEGVERWRALRLQSLADGAALAAGRLFADERRAEDDRSVTVMARQSSAVEAALDAFDAELLRREMWTIGEVAVGVVLGYLDFRWPGRDWRRGRLRLAKWARTTVNRTEMTATRHPTQV